MKRILAMLLMAAMLTSLIACGNSSVIEETEAATEGTTEPVETRTPSNVPAGTTFDGATYRAGFIFGGTDKYFADEMTGDNMNDAVYRRQKNVEQTLDVKLAYTEEVDTDEYKQLYKAGDDIYQELHLHLISNVADFVTEGYVYNVDTLPYVDYTADWYNAEQMEALRLGKNTYYVVSDYVITNPGIVIFNKNMIVDNNMQNPYDMVKAGTWTLDKMVQMAIDVRQDKNGDGEYTSEDDIYGIHMMDTSISSPFTMGCGQPLGTKDPVTGKYSMTMNNEYTYACLDELYRLFENPGSVNYQVVDFQFGTSLFTLAYSDSVEMAADITQFEIGVLPFPKLNEAQDRYYSRDWAGLMCISGSIRNPELVGAVIEQLAWESGNEVVDTYYNKLLKTRYAADPETREMLELVFDSVAYDALGNYFGFTDGFCGLFYLPTQPIFFGQTNYAALFRAAKSRCAADLLNFYTALEKIEGPLETAE